MAIALILTLAILSILLFIHDLVPMGRWNNVGYKPLLPLLANVIPNTAVGFVPLYLACRTISLHGSSPGRNAILITLSCVVLGELISWWIPWLIGGISNSRRAELAAISINTVTFVPERNGVTPNALHCIIHLLTVAALVEVILLIRA